MDTPDKQTRIVEARMKLKARFEEKMKMTPSVGDDKPMRKGNLNRHGMPVIPPGQTITTKWPVLDLGSQPDISLKDWRLVLDGEVENPAELSWEEFMALPHGGYFGFPLCYHLVKIEHTLERCSPARPRCIGGAQRNSHAYPVLW